VIDVAIAAPVAGGRDTVMLPPVDVVTLTVPVDKAATIEAEDVVTAPLVFPVLVTEIPAEFGAPVPPLGAPPTADGVLAAGVGFGAKVPPVVPELPPFVPLLSEPLLVGSAAKLACTPGRPFCAVAVVDTASTAAAQRAALLNKFVIESSPTGYKFDFELSSIGSMNVVRE